MKTDIYKYLEQIFEVGPDEGGPERDQAQGPLAGGRYHIL